jgi:hypothetical protein
VHEHALDLPVAGLDDDVTVDEAHDADALAVAPRGIAGVHQRPEDQPVDPFALHGSTLPATMARRVVLTGHLCEMAR